MYVSAPRKEGMRDTFRSHGTCVGVAVGSWRCRKSDSCRRLCPYRRLAVDITHASTEGSLRLVTSHFSYATQNCYTVHGVAIV